MNIAFAQIAMQLLPYITTGAKELWAFITKVRGAAQQSEEWTPAMELLFQQRLIDHQKEPAYQPDAPEM